MEKTESRIRDLQKQVDALVGIDEMSQALINEYNRIGNTCIDALDVIIIRNEYPDADMIAIKLARKVISGYANIFESKR